MRTAVRKKEASQSGASFVVRDLYAMLSACPAADTPYADIHCGKPDG